jgi:uncharacterized lipoprotein YddW (UPF0748 family)
MAKTKPPPLNQKHVRSSNSNLRTNISGVILRILAKASLCLILFRSGAAEFRGLWVDAFGPGFFNAEQVKKLAADCRKYNFNAVIVEMRRRGDAFYNSNYDPRTTIITTNFDALAEIIKACHTGTPRIEVHCWVVSHFIWSWEKPPKQPNHIFNRHPEYLTKDSIGQKFIGKGYFLDPGNPDANLTIWNMAKDIVSRYDIDGFHWDYCRYPGRDSGYNETALKRFNEQFGLNGQPPPNDPKFSEWRRRQVTDFLRWVDADLWEIKPNLVISASVFGNITDSYGYRFADWPAWSKEGIVDVCIPMEFSPDNKNIFFPRVDDALKSQGFRHVYVGQAAYLSTKENTLTQLEYIRRKGFPGTVLYDYRQPNQGQLNQDAVFAFLKERFQPESAETPALPWKRTKGILKGTVTRTETHTPVYNAVITLDTQPARTQKTEPHGGYAFFDISPGKYSVRAEIRDAGLTTETVEVKPGQVVSLNLSLGR